jgi:hypothetical protein
MTNILNQVARDLRQRARFRPATTDEFFALRLAVRLGDGPAVRHYADLAQRYSRDQLLSAYGRALAYPGDISRRFHQHLERMSGRRNGNGAGKLLAAIRIERRAVGVAILAGDHLRYADARQLASSSEKAATTAAIFVTRLCEKFQIGSAVLEIITNHREIHRTDIRESVVHALRIRSISITEVPETDLVSSLGYPAPRFRRDLRKTVAGIYAVLTDTLGLPWTLDAAALGLYAQTERLFNTINQPLL